MRAGQVPDSFGWFTSEEGVVDLVDRWDPQRANTNFQTSAVVVDQPNADPSNGPKVVTVDGQTLVALAIGSGSLQSAWKYTMGSSTSCQLAVTGSPGSQVVVGLKTGDVISIAPDSAETKPSWTVSGPASCLATGSMLALNASVVSGATGGPVSGQGAVAVAFDCPISRPVVWLLDAKDGSVLWQSPVVPNATAGAKPALGPNGLTLGFTAAGSAALFLGDQSSGMHALSLGTGRFLWSVLLEPQVISGSGPPAFDAGSGSVWVTYDSRTTFQLAASGAVYGGRAANAAYRPPAPVALGWPTSRGQRTAVVCSDRIQVLSASSAAGRAPDTDLTFDTRDRVPSQGIAFATGPLAFGPGRAAAAGHSAGSWAVLAATEGGGLLFGVYDRAAGTARVVWAVWLTSSRRQSASARNAVAPSLSLVPGCGVPGVTQPGPCAIVTLANGSIALVGRVRDSPLPSPAPSPSPSPAPANPGGIQPGELAGIVLGGLAGVGLAAGLVWFACRRRGGGAASDEYTPFREESTEGAQAAGRTPWE